LALGAGSAAMLVLAGGTLALLVPGVKDAKLTAPSRDVFAAVARALLDATLPAQGRAAAIEGLLSRIDALIANLPPHAQEELSQLLALLASAPGRRTFAGITAPWPDAAASDIQSALDAMRRSSITLRQQAYQALHDIVGAAYFSEPGTWAAIGYPGPTAI
jgi:hypothetical protein